MHPQIGILLVIFFLSTFAFSIFESTFALFLSDRLSLDMKHVTYIFVFVGILAAIVQGGLIGRLVKRFGERRLILVGGLLLIPGYLSLLAAHSVLGLMVYLVPLALGVGLTGPSLSSLISRLSTAEEQGGILGVSQSMASFARITGPFWGVFAYERFGLASPYITAALAALAVLALAYVVLRRAAAFSARGGSGAQAS